MGFVDVIYPVLVLHLLLLPLNVKRLVEIRQLIRDIKRAFRPRDLVDAYDPLPREANLQRGTGTLFRKGDRGNSPLRPLPGGRFACPR